ncbi:Nrd1 complex RNA-binding subunit [Sparganum proliferum]
MLISSLKPGETVEDEAYESVEDSDCEETAEESEGVDDEGDMEVEDECASKKLRRSAAALCINVGSFADPREAQGLAHFLEHMVFMGSEKYPGENDFDEYVSQRGGSSNAFTDGEHTVFYFEIQWQHFKASLDRFANFFIAPLLGQDGVDRELEAVHSEFELAKAEDPCRSEHLLTSIAKENSPYRIFAYGNRKSLKENPAAAGTDVYRLLREFQHRYYTAPLMTLAVEAKDTLENLENLVTEIFQGIPNRGDKPFDLSVFREPFDMGSFNKLYKVCPVKETVSLSLTWTLPPMQTHYKACPLKLLGCIVGHEGKGSLLAYLREQNLAVELTAGTATNSDSQYNQMNSLFKISIELSELGRKAPDTVASLVFSYLHMLREAATFSLENPQADTLPSGCRSLSSLVPEYQKLYEAQFRFQEPFDPADTVQYIAHAMLISSPEEVYTYDNLMTEPDLKLYAEVIGLLLPDRANIELILPEFAQEAAKDATYLTEPWFDIKFKVEGISEDQLQVWRNPPVVPEFHLPEVNRFITTNFDLLPACDNQKVPQDLNLEPGREACRKFGRLWHQQQTKFNVPIAHVITSLRSNLPRCPKNKVQLKLLAAILDQRLQTLVYAATEANLSFSISGSRGCLTIHVSGFNEKLLLLYQEILALVVAPVTGSESGLQLDGKKFATYKDRLRQKTCNKVLNPADYNSHIRQYFADEKESLVEDFMKALQSVELEDFQAFVPAFLSTLYMKTYAYGNLSKAEAEAFFDFTVKTLNASPGLSKIEPSLPAYPLHVSHLRLMNFNKQDVNTCLALVAPLLQTPSEDLRLEVLNNLFASCLNEPAFAYLRTLETLGYVVSLYSWNLSATGQAGITLLVCSQANKFETTRVAGRMYAFWFRIIPHIVLRLKPDAFATTVNSCIASNQLDDPTMDVELRRNKKEILSDRPIFDRRERAVEILRSLTLQDLQEFYRSTFYNNDKQPLLMIQVDATSGIASNTNASTDGNSSSVAQTLKTFDWPVTALPVTSTQLSDEQTSAESVDLSRALKSCAAGLIAQPESPATGLDLPPPPTVVPIDDARAFKHTVLFPSSSPAAC